MNWLNTFKHLLPNARAWRLTVDKNLRRFFEGLTGLNQDAKNHIDSVYQDLDPQKTRALSLWEQQFALLDTGLTEQERRDRLAATWRALGGQDPRYIQDTLQAAGFDVYVHEWWQPIPAHLTGGSVNFDVTPVARNPFLYLSDGSTPSPFTMFDGGGDSQDGDPESQDGGTAVPTGYPLVNKLREAIDVPIGDGYPQMVDGGQLAQDGGLITIYRKKQYVMPADTSKYPYFLYIGGETFPENATVPSARREEFEDLCLKICPLEQWLGILVSYN